MITFHTKSVAQRGNLYFGPAGHNEDISKVARFQTGLKSNMSTTPKYKLTYFNVTARAEPIRLILAAAGVKYEDVRIKREDWPKMKPSKNFMYYIVMIIETLISLVFILYGK